MAYTANEQRAHREQWAEALRSGRYTQSYKSLRRDNVDSSGEEDVSNIDRNYCVLGVACEESGLGTWEKFGIMWVYNTEVSATYDTLPIPVQEYYGLTTNDGEFVTEDDTLIEYAGNSRVCLAALNDMEVDFEILASIIESEPDGLVV